ncbi:MAG TPA: glycosyltransferase [Kofleriaceae bacterium]|jgi:glycosyltransferase involved in cell wall biosynthesis|nr:glycosyltransferase [Kofleriaceae bacterium]
MANRTILIIPCYNEARRLDVPAVNSLLDDDSVDLILVNDGSTDTTQDILEGMARARPRRVRVLALEENQGKAEAVRRGLVAALEAGAEIVGYLDADLATPPAEIRRLIGLLRGSDAQVMVGARVALLGHKIERSPLRHYLGRVFATLASVALHKRVYDTQCGAKLFRRSNTLADAVREPFLSRWAFDVELFGRLFLGSESAPPIPDASVWEEPLQTWCDVKGSKLSARQMARALADLGRIWRDLAAQRARRGPRAVVAPEPVAPSDAGARPGHDLESTRVSR